MAHIVHLWGNVLLRNIATASMKRLMEMVRLQRQAWEEQQQQRVPPVVSSSSSSSKDTTTSTDPASLSVATASSR